MLHNDLVNLSKRRQNIDLRFALFSLNGDLTRNNDTSHARILLWEDQVMQNRCKCYCKCNTTQGFEAADSATRHAKRRTADPTNVG